MAITWDDVVLLDPAFEDVPSEVQDDILATVELLIPEGPWGDRWALAQRYVAAHLATEWLAVQAAGGSGSVGSSGPVTQETVGPISRSYADYGAVVAGSSAWFDMFKGTVWGRRYIYLVRTNPNLIVGLVV